MTGTSFHSKRIAKYFPNMPYDSMKLRFRQTPEPDILRQLERHVRYVYVIHSFLTHTAKNNSSLCRSFKFMYKSQLFLVACINWSVIILYCIFI